VVLFEDGVPRSFTIFEAPPVHLTLDLIVMFDVTNPKADQKGGGVGFWDAKDVRDLANYWTEAITRRLLNEHAATIRFSIYRFDQSKLQRLCQSTSDPKVLLDALRRLAGPLPAGQAPGQDVDIPLPAGLAVRAVARRRLANNGPPEPWSLTGALSALRDSAVTPLPGADKATAARALVIFSTGAEGTALTPQNLADQAVAANVPVYPVALMKFLPWALPYDGYGSDGVVYSDIRFEGPRGSIWGPGGLLACQPLSPDCPRNLRSLYINYPFELLGDLTGGLRFEAVNHSQPVTPGENAQGFALADASAFSMTGGETDDILERAEKHAIARFSSNYTVGFVPSPSGDPREHKLEVKLAPKSSGKVTDGKRIAIY
jgi:hypothetical protein